MTDSLVPVERIARSILVLRGQKVILDQDLAALFGVTTKQLNQQVKRHAGRFPEDFAFQLTDAEYANLRSQSVTSSWGGRRYPPWVFTEHGAIAAAFVLNSDTAIAASVHVVRTFVQIRQILASNQTLAAKIAALERRTNLNTAELQKLAVALKQLVAPPVPTAPRRRIGFDSDDKGTAGKPGGRARRR